MDVSDGKALRRHVAGVVPAQAELHKQVLDKVQASRDRQRASASRGMLPNFSVGKVRVGSTCSPEWHYA